MLTNLTQGDVDKIVIDEGVAIVNYGETDERVIGLVKGGMEATITPTYRNIDYDGSRGDEMGMQVYEGETAVIKFNTICSSQENLALCLPMATVNDKKLEQGSYGIISKDKYLKNIACLTEQVDGKFKVLVIRNALSEGALAYKPKPKAENEHSLEIKGHHNPMDRTEKMWYIEELDSNPLAK